MIFSFFSIIKRNELLSCLFDGGSLIKQTALWIFIKINYKNSVVYTNKKIKR